MLTELLDSHWSLYSIDYRRACFVRMPLSIEHYQAEAAPFLYLKQHAYAVEVATISIQQLHQLAQMVRCKSNCRALQKLFAYLNDTSS